MSTDAPERQGLAGVVEAIQDLVAVHACGELDVREPARGDFRVWVPDAGGDRRAAL